MGLGTSSNFITAVEKSAQFEFPSLWREKLVVSNGFEFELAQEEWQSFPVKDSSSRKHIIRTANDILRETGVAKSWPGFPQDCVALASNGSGDYIVIRQHVNDLSIWNHETRSLTPVAATQLSEALRGVKVAR